MHVSTYYTHVHKLSKKLSATKENFVIWATWHLGFRHPC